MYVCVYVQILHQLFREIDQDGSGEIDKLELRLMLKHLKLTYSDSRYNRILIHTYIHTYIHTVHMYRIRPISYILLCVPRFKILFQAMDSDADGKITVDDFQNLLFPKVRVFS